MNYKSNPNSRNNKNPCNQNGGTGLALMPSLTFLVYDRKILVKVDALVIFLK